MTIATRPALSVSAADRVELAQALIAFHALFVLDDAWTGLAAQPDARSEADIEALTTVGGALLAALQPARRGAAWLQDYVVRTGAATLRDGLLAARDAVDDDRRAEVDGLVEEFGDQIGRLTESGYRALVQGLPTQRLALVEELAAILHGAPADGDLLKNVLCSTLALSVVGGIVSTALPPHVHGLALAATGRLAYASFRCNLDELEDARRWRWGASGERST